MEYFDWMEDVGPAILQNLNELLVAKNIEPLVQLCGGSFKDGKWVGILDSKDYRNYWHVYLELFGEGLRNDQYQVEYFPEVEDDWYRCYELADKFCEEQQRSGYDHTDPHWARDLVTATKKWVDENVDPHNPKVTFWWSW
jgi:hypothetical protein